MTNTGLTANQSQALKACFMDTLSFYTFLMQLIRHPKQNELVMGLIPFVSMHIIESYKCFTNISPELGESLKQVEILQKSRHRAKLLDDELKTIIDVANSLAAIVEKQRQSFDGQKYNMGLYLYDNHIFSTTHSIHFGLGQDMGTEDLTNLGIEIGKYLKGIITLCGYDSQENMPILRLPGTITTKDMGIEDIYKKGLFGSLPIEITAALLLLLSNLNYVRYILSHLLGDETIFRVKFITLFHANASIISIQDYLRQKGSLPEDVGLLFSKALGNKESRWLRKQKSLRHFLTHYLLNSEPPYNNLNEIDRMNLIERMAGKSFQEINPMLDQHLKELISILDDGFSLNIK